MPRPEVNMNLAAKGDVEDCLHVHRVHMFIKHSTVPSVGDRVYKLRYLLRRVLGFWAHRPEFEVARDPVIMPNVGAIPRPDAFQKTEL